MGSGHTRRWEKHYFKHIGSCIPGLNHQLQHLEWIDSIKPAKLPPDNTCFVSPFSSASKHPHVMSSRRQTVAYLLIMQRTKAAEDVPSTSQYWKQTSSHSVPTVTPHSCLTWHATCRNTWTTRAIGKGKGHLTKRKQQTTSNCPSHSNVFRINMLQDDIYT